MSLSRLLGIVEENELDEFCTYFPEWKEELEKIKKKKEQYLVRLEAAHQALEHKLTNEDWILATVKLKDNLSKQITKLRPDKRKEIATYITKELIEQISLLEPFGKGNTKPIFAQKGLRVLDSSIIGKNKNVVKLKLLDPQGVTMEGIYFGEAEDFANFIRQKDTISVTYYPEINRFRGRESLQIIIQNYC